MIKLCVLSKKLTASMTVYTGYIKVFDEKNKYLYSIFSDIQRLNKEHAKNDAKILANDLKMQGG